MSGRHFFANAFTVSRWGVWPSMPSVSQWVSHFFLGITVILVCFGTSISAHAEVCAELVRRAGSSQESAALSKQLAAISALERRRQCASKGTGGWFNPCADLAARKAEVQRKLSRAGGGATVSRARLVALGCLAPKRSQQVAGRNIGPYVGNHAILFCVRTRDGYFFPVPRSQFVHSSDYKQVVDQCQYICQDKETVVYRLDDPSIETEEMVSVEKGTPYKELATAFSYRQNAEFKGCDFQRYYRRVDEARARTLTPSNLENTVIPLPGEKPPAGAPLPLLAINEEPKPAPAIEMPANRQVRVVGPNFFPE